jgi:hypothetical protein
MEPSPLTLPAQLPANVRADGPRGRTLYSAALGFEEMLVRTLTESLARSSETGDDESGDAAAVAARAQLPDALAGAITAAGGLGLAATLYDSLREGVGL